MKANDKVNVEMTAEMLIDLWNYYNANTLAQNALKEHYSTPWKVRNIVTKWECIDNQLIKFFPQRESIAYPTVENMCEPEFTPIEVHINSDYVAIVNEDGVRVGCQCFTFDRIEELHKQIQKVKNKKS